jgi:hypothetical protein
VRKRNSDSFVRVPIEPDFFILFLNFIAKAKSKNLAVNGNAAHDQVSTIFALHIGVVTAWCFQSMSIYSYIDVIVLRMSRQTLWLVLVVCRLFFKRPANVFDYMH